ncbi:MAG: flagellar basal-body MS-ring/collar protein FliF [Kofleriaceae bacterium]
MSTPPPTRGGPAEVARQLRELYARQPRGRRLGAIAVLLAVAAAVALPRVLREPSSWSVVGEPPTAAAADELLATLQGRGLSTRLVGRRVEVPAAQLATARAAAAAAGLPRGGTGYELFDKSSLGQSSFVEQVNFRRALQGELERTLTAMPQVESARVQLTLGKRSVFKDREAPPSASVALRLFPGQPLTQDQVRGVQQLVAASVEQLEPTAVVVVDAHGNLLEGGAPTAGGRQAEIESGITQRVRTMLERVVGVGKVAVVTSAEVDPRTIAETEEVYDKDRTALRSEVRSLAGAAAPAVTSGIAGVQGNLQGTGASPPAAAPTPGGETNLAETRNFEVTRTLRQTQTPEARLQKLHVAVIVDYKRDADDAPVAPSAEELGAWTALATQAAGLDPSRGDSLELRALPFAAELDEAAAAPVPAVFPLVPVAAGGGAGLLALAVAVVALLRRRRRRRAAEATVTTALPAPVSLPAQVVELERALEAQPTLATSAALGGADAGALPPGQPVEARINDVVRSDVDRAAAILSAWLEEPASQVRSHAA